MGIMYFQITYAVFGSYGCHDGAVSLGQGIDAGGAAVEHGSEYSETPGP